MDLGLTVLWDDTAATSVYTEVATYEYTFFKATRQRQVCLKHMTSIKPGTPHVG